MLIEKTLVFLLPIAPNLQELKKSIEDDEENDFTIYEMDSIGEFNQLVGILEHAVVFSSDLKKSSKALQDNKSILSGNTHSFVVVSDQEVKPDAYKKLQKFGMKELIGTGTASKSLMHKIDMHFGPFVAAAEKARAAREKSIAPDKIKIKREAKDTIITSTQKVKAHDNLTFRTDEKKDDKKRIKRGDLDLNQQIAGHTKVSEKYGDLSFASPSLNMQRKKVTQFNPVDLPSKLKRGSFQPVEHPWNEGKRKTHDFSGPGTQDKRGQNTDISLGEGKDKERKKLDLPQQQDYGRKSGGPKFEKEWGEGKGLEFDQKELKRKKVDFEEVQRELQKKKNAQLDLARDLEKKRKNLDLNGVDPKKKKGVMFDTPELEKKRKQFEEVEADYNKKRKTLELLENDLEKKKKTFEEVEIELPKKKGALFEAQELQKKKRAILDELEQANKKKGLILDEIELEKKRKKFDEVQQQAGKKKGLELEEAELKKKKGADFEEVEIQKKDKQTFEEVERELGKKKGVEFQEADLGKKKNKIDLAALDVSLKKNNFEEITPDKKKKKHGTFEEVKRKKEFKSVEIDNVFQKKQAEETGIKGKNSDYEEQVLDYGKFKKQYREGQLSDDAPVLSKAEREEIAKLLAEPEYTFFPALTYGIEYLINFLQLWENEKTPPEVLYKFIDFTCKKKYEGSMQLLQMPSQRVLYQSNDEISHSLENLNEIELPTWLDETYQSENEFYYPYFEDGNKLALAIIHTKEAIKSHDDAAELEMMLMVLKGLVMEEK
jgi:hypothetical protein